MNKSSSFVAALLLVPAVALSQNTVHYPDAVHETGANNIAFPFYTPGGGAAGLTVRTQFRCPDAFLAGQGLSDGYVTHVGFSIGGEATYSQFQLRAGVAGATTFGPDWAVNLPDQRVQVDLSGQAIQGGGTASTPVNEWVDFELAFPFHYESGDDVIVDLVTNLAVIDQYLITTPAAGQVERAYNFSYFPGATATNFNSNGIKVRFTFVPLEMIPFGDGCQASNGLTPVLRSVGAPQINQPLAITADQALANELGVFVYGFSRDSYQGAPLPADLGGSCSLLVSADILEPVVISAMGEAFTGLFFPNDPMLHGAVLFCQFAQLDVLLPATVPFTLSNAGVLSIF